MTTRGSRRGLMWCPWGCREVVRLTVNDNARRIFIDLPADERGLIAAWDPGGTWRSRQLQKGEAPTGPEDRYLIHQATCVRWCRVNHRVPLPRMEPT